MEDKIKELEEQYNSLKEQYARLSEQTSNVYTEMHDCARKLNKCKQDSFRELSHSKIGKYYLSVDYNNEENIVTHRYVFIKDACCTTLGGNYFLVDLIEWTIINGDICDFQYIKDYSLYVSKNEDYVETTGKEFNDFLTYCNERKR